MPSGPNGNSRTRSQTNREVEWKSPGGASVTQGGMLLTGPPAPTLFTAASPTLFAAQPETPPLTLYFFRVKHCLPYEAAQEVTLQGSKAFI